MNVFITGATGFIGHHLLTALLRELPEHSQVYLLSRVPMQHDDNRVVPLHGQLEEIQKFEAELLDSTYVYHLGGIATFGDNANYHAVNLEPTRTIAAILQKSNTLKNCIYTSTIGAYDRHKDDDCSAPINTQSQTNPRSDYGRSKLAAEQALIASKIPCTILRPAWVYGEGMRSESHLQAFISMIIKGSPVIRLAFPGKVTLIHVNDLVDALVSCLNNPSVTDKQFFAGTEALSLGDIFSVLTRQIRSRTPRQLPVPRFNLLFRRIHSRIPITLANLFMDYLTCDINAFTQAFDIPSPRLLQEHAETLVKDHGAFAGAWIITGANSGIGLALTKLLHKQRRQLILVDRNIDNLNGFTAMAVKADLSSEEGVRGVVQAVKGKRIACLINNAGLGFKGGIKELDEDQISATVSVNILAPMRLTKQLLPRMVKDRSTIVNMASSVSYNPLPGMSVYAASKSFVTYWSEALSYELARTNHVVTVSPAGTITNFQKSSNVKIQKGGRGLLQPEYVATKILSAVQKKSSLVNIGLPSRVLLTICKFLPRQMNARIWGRLFGAVR